MTQSPAEVAGQLWPVYVVADESDSMSPYLDQLNDGLDSIRQRLGGQPMAAAKVRFSVLGFATDATLRSHLVDLRSAVEFAPLRTGGATEYGEAFRLLADQIPRDVARLKSEGYRVYRPAVFFLSDGNPTDEPGWSPVRDRLVDRMLTPAAPNIIAFGIGAVDGDVIRRVATQPTFAFVSTEPAQIGAAIQEFFSSLLRSLVASTSAPADAPQELIVEPPRRFRVELDVV
ncbi:vWA domain-containing protein [Cryptosporangium aurantiacum]|nr:VWA domain-containing protein [Cryptosporangium aurantiacum]